MKKSVKKLIAIIMTLTLMASFIAIEAGAYKIGDVINYAQPTNIATLINGYQMMSFNVDGYTYVVVEDLRYYGFNVAYDNATRSLSVERNYGVTQITPHNTNPKFWEIGSNKTRKNILYTDIATYIAGKYVSSYNIDGQTIIRFDELASFGLVDYNDEIRELSLVIDNMEYNTIATVVASAREEELANLLPSFNASAKSAYGNHTSCDIFFRAKGNIIVYELYLNGIVLNAAQRRVEQNGFDNMKSVIKSNYQQVKEMYPELAGVAFIFYDASGSEIASTTIAL